MPPRKEETPPEPRRREIFQALVEAQDQDLGLVWARKPSSDRNGSEESRSENLGSILRNVRKVLADRFGVSESQIKQIEQEGLDREWPPL